MAGAGVRHILRPGPWSHSDVSAHGLRFHVAVGAGFSPARPLVVLLHGFAQFWWAWRHVLPALDTAGYAVAALDLRGSGASDSPPRGYEPASVAADVSGLVRALGFAEAVLVGHDLGARAGWATCAYAPDQVRALAVVAAPHPADRRHRLRPYPGPLLPVLPERRVGAHEAAWVGAYLDRLTARPGRLSSEELAVYRSALRAWPGPRGALAPVRLAGPRTEASRDLVRRVGAVDLPVLAVRGALDRVVPAAALDEVRSRVRGPFAAVTLPGVGHLPAEEDAAALTVALLDWLDGLPPGRD